MRVRAREYERARTDGEGCKSVRQPARAHSIHVRAQRQTHIQQRRFIEDQLEARRSLEQQVAQGMQHVAQQAQQARGVMEQQQKALGAMEEHKRALQARGAQLDQRVADISAAWRRDTRSPRTLAVNEGVEHLLQAVDGMVFTSYVLGSRE